MKLIKESNINIITLCGTPEEMAFQHGKLLKQKIKDCALQKLANKNQILIKQAGGFLSNKAIQQIAITFYTKILVPVLALSLPNIEKRKLKAVSKGADIPYKTLLLAFYQADGLMMLSRLSLMSFLFAKFPKSQIPGCSSAVASNNMTKNKTMLVMRNQDYPIVDTWEKLTTVALCKPKGKNKQKYIFVTSAGLHTGGLTAMNESGLTVAVHAHFGKRVSIYGSPIFHIAEKIVANANNIEDAENIVKKAQTHANWTIVVASAFEKMAVAFEITPQRFKKRFMKNEKLTHTNFFQNTELNQEEALINGSRHDDDFARIKQMNKSLDDKKGNLEIQDLMRLSGEHTDPNTNTLKSFGNTVSVMTTVKSVVMDPSNFTIYVSNRDKTPVGIGNFLKINENSFDGESIETIKNPINYDKDFIHNLDQYRNAYIKGSNDHEYLEAYQIIKNIIRNNNVDAHLYMQCAFLALKNDLKEEALNHFLSIDQSKITEHMKDCVNSFISTIYKNRGDEDNHIKYKKMVSPKPCKKIQRFMKKGKIKPELIMLDMQFPEPIEY